MGVCRFVEPLPWGSPRECVAVGVAVTGGVGLGCGELVVGGGAGVLTGAGVPGAAVAGWVADALVLAGDPTGRRTPGALLVGPRASGVVGAGRVGVLLPPAS